MEYLTHELISAGRTEELAEFICKDKSAWQDGKKTAGSQAAKVKNNFQLDRDSKTSKEASSQVISKIVEDQLLKSFCLPRKIHGVMFSRSGEGQGYGHHVDNAYMSSGRSDLSFTLFLSPPNQYKGGELCIQTIQDSQEFKLPAGHIVIYPSTSLHSVNKVDKGERLVCVGWIESYVSSNEDRNILFGLDAGAKGLMSNYGHSPQLDLVFQAYNNLLRRLGD